MFKKHTYLHIYYEGARLVSSLVAFTQKDQTLIKIASFFIVFTQNLRLLGVGGGHEIYNLCPPFPTNPTYKIWRRMVQ